jgi:uncharacterized membrane protein
MKINLFLILFVLTVVGFAISVLFVVGGIVQPSIDYSDNRTDVRNKIAAQNVPTVINGITTSTSIIIGFTGTLMGILREMFRNNNKKKEALVAFAVLIPLSVVFLFYANFYLAMGGQNFLELAWRSALLALVISIFNLLFLFLALASEMEKPEADNVEPVKLVESEQEKLKREFQHRAV